MGWMDDGRGVVARTETKDWVGEREFTLLIDQSAQGACRSRAMLCSVQGHAAWLRNLAVVVTSLKFLYQPL